MSFNKFLRLFFLASILFYGQGCLFSNKSNLNEVITDPTVKINQSEDGVEIILMTPEEVSQEDIKLIRNGQELNLSWKHSVDSETNVHTYTFNEILGANGDYTYEVFVNDGKEFIKIINETISFNKNDPRVDISLLDSVVTIKIIGSSAGNQNEYDIYRNGTKIGNPFFQLDTNTGSNNYFFVETLSDTGVFRYEIHFPSVDGNPKVKVPRTISFYGPEKSGTLLLEYNSQLHSVILRYQESPDFLISQIILERKIVQDGEVQTLDTIRKSSQSWPIYIDSVPLLDKKWVYFRVNAFDAVTEGWLGATKWDSLLIDNKNWNYLPLVRFQNLGTKINAYITNPSQLLGTSYYLYRSKSTNRNEGVLRDSFTISNSLLNLELTDQPNEKGEYYYWVDSKDNLNRISPRSLPEKIFFPNELIGPEINSLDFTSASIRLQFYTLTNAEYYIIERTDDISSNFVVLDTISNPNPQSTMLYEDHPPKSGIWYYRIKIITIDEELSNPGPWKKSDEWTFNQSYSLLSGVSLGNFGQYISLTVNSSSNNYMYIFYRGKNSNFIDSIALDTTLGFGTITFEDIPYLGTHYYWVERLPIDWVPGQTIYRSNPIKVDFDGRWIGPEITTFSYQSNYIRVNFIPQPGSSGYILERTMDTSSAIQKADTVSSSSSYFNDVPPQNGKWFFRIIVLANGLQSNPGPWNRSMDWELNQPYSSLSGVSIRNAGDKVFGTITSYSNGYNYFLVRAENSNRKNPLVVDSNVESFNRVLEDKPENGTHYYWIERKQKNWIRGNTIYRTSPLGILFNGIALGPQISSAKNSSYISLSVVVEPKMAAYVLQRTKDTSSTDIINIETLPVKNSSTVNYLERPPENGLWFYRAIGLKENTETTPPGNWTWQDFTFLYTPRQLTGVVIHNKGKEIEANFSPSFSYNYFLLRSTKSNYEEGTRVDSIIVGQTSTPLVDIPNHGEYYYWVERYSLDLSNNYLYRSTPQLINFNGKIQGPSITSLVQNGSTINIQFSPSLNSGDTLQVWRTGGHPDSLSLYLKIAENSLNRTTNNYTDASLTSEGLFQYRIRKINGSESSELGPAKAIYFTK